MSTPSPSTRIGRALGVAAVVVGVQAALVAMYGWPAANLAPRDLPVVATGPEAATRALTAQLTEAVPGGFAITTVPDAATADQALRDREAYAAFLLGPDGLTLHLASAASPVVAQLLTAEAQRVGQRLAQATARPADPAGSGGQTAPGSPAGPGSQTAPGSPAGPGSQTAPGGAAGASGATQTPVKVIDIVPTDADDPRGAGFASGFLPLVITSLVAGVVLFTRTSGRLAHLLGVIGYAALSGLVGAALLGYGLDALPGGYLANAGAIGLLALAMCATVVGLARLFGYPGIGLGMITFFAIGNPLSAVTAAPELLPQPLGQVGQWLPPGAGGTLLRSVAYFDGAGAGRPALILAIWAAAGLSLVAVNRPLLRPTRAAAPVPAPVPVPAG